ncbi:ROK family transcriptional regulator [Microbacteriaceae bacterium VKM Ac-2854]|nr:ROK family transcriptional regulator [Microbacteriaceae bacterium VKM Ac-2854]
MPESSLLEFDTGVHRSGDARRRNLLVVLACIEAHGTIPQRDIGDETGLPHAAVSIIVTQLIERGLLTEQTSAPTGSRGRPRRLLSLAADAATAVGVDISAEGIAVRAVDPAGRLIDRRSLAHRSTDVSTAEFSRLIFGLIAETIPRSSAPLSVVLALPGLNDEGMTTSPSRGWFSAPVDDLFHAAPSELIARRVLNDGDAAVTAEYTRASASATRNVAVLHGSDGIAGGVVAEGRLLLGYAGAASSLGHVPIRPGGERCECGSFGCFQTEVSIVAFQHKLGRGDIAASDSLSDVAAALAADARSGDEAVLAVLARAREQITALVRVLGAVLSPEVVVLTGNLMPLAPWLVTPAGRSHLQQGSTIDWISPVIASGFDDESVAVGAAELARRTLLLQPELISARR